MSVSHWSSGVAINLFQEDRDSFWSLGTSLHNHTVIKFYYWTFVDLFRINLLNGVNAVKLNSRGIAKLSNNYLLTRIDHPALMGMEFVYHMLDLLILKENNKLRSCVCKHKCSYKFEKIFFKTYSELVRRIFRSLRILLVENKKKIEVIPKHMFWVFLAHSSIYILTNAATASVLMT